MTQSISTNTPTFTWLAALEPFKNKSIQILYWIQMQTKKHSEYNCLNITEIKHDAENASVENHIAHFYITLQHLRRPCMPVSVLLRKLKIHI